MVCDNALKDAISENGHALCRVRVGRTFRTQCLNCLEARPRLAVKFWAHRKCHGAEEVCPSVAAAAAGGTYEGTFQQFCTKRDAIRRANASFASQNRRLRREATRVFADGLPVKGSTVESVGSSNAPGPPPQWITKLHQSHSLRFGGGAVWCDHCGSALRQLRKGCALLLQCKGEMAMGSQYKVKKLSEGDCKSYWSSWPDGRSSSTVVQSRRWT